MSSASNVRSNIPAQRVRQVTLLNSGVEHHFSHRPTDAAITRARADVYGTGDPVLLNVVLRSGLKVCIMIRSFPVEHGRQLFTGVIANGSELVAVHGSLFGVRDGWLKLDQTLSD